MSLYADAYAAGRRKTQFGALEPRLMFLDIGQKACEAFFEQRHALDRCRSGHPAQPELLYEVLVRVLNGSQSPVVVVVDAALVDRKVAPDWPDRNHRPLESGDTPVIYTLFSRVAEEPHTVWLDDREDPIDEGLIVKEGAYATLAQTFSETADGDEILRRYAPALVARPIDGGRRYLKATVAMAAAIAAVEGRNALRRLEAELRSGGGPSCSAGDTHRAGSRYGFESKLTCLAALTRDIEGGSSTHVPELLFTLRSLAYPFGAETESSPAGITASDESDIGRAAYIRVPIDDVTRMQDFPPSIIKLLAGAIVVLGTSAASANDTHATPIGKMAGAEVVLNATRAFLSFPIASHHSVFAELGHELVLILFLSLPFLVLWLVVEWLSAHLRNKSLPRAIGIRLVIAVVFVGGVVAIFLIFLAWEVEHSVPLVAEGQPPPDVLTPILALALEGFAKAAKWFLDLIHLGVEHAMAKV